MKKILGGLLCVILLLSFVGCGGKKDPTVELLPEPEPEIVVPTVCVNPFTGIEDLPIENKNLRPVAVMINNIRVAQSVQTGVQKADLIYETEVEGGITRLMAVFKDISAVSQIGTVRSARYAYIDLALGHDAVYVHCGIDPTYAAPHVKSSGVEDFNINSHPWAAYGFREANGLATEHTMYTSSEKIKQGMEKLSIRNTTEKLDTFCAFSSEVKKPAEGGADTVTVPFSNAATSIFTYDKEIHKYTKNSKGTTNKDCKTGDAYQITNVFVLQTSITNYPDGYHRKVDLNGGTGYYISEGGYKQIIWKKAGEKSPIQYFNPDNTPLEINPGKSWICIQNANYTPVFETAPEPVPESTPAP